MSVTGFSPIDLSKLPAPQVVEKLNFEVIFQEMLSGFKSRHPEYSSIVESDPVYKALEEAAYREMLLRQRVNEAARAVMLAYALGSDLDNLAALAPVERKMIDAGDASAVPPVPPTYEDDEEFRARTQLAPEGFSVAGPEQGYRFHALKVAEVRDASAITPIPGRVEVYILSRNGSGETDSNIINAVNTVVNSEKVRPLTDSVVIKSAEIISYNVIATLQVGDGPSDSVVVNAARSTLSVYTTRAHALGSRVSLSGMLASLHVEGVVDVKLVTPVESIVCDLRQAPYCISINLDVVRI